jgi:tetratricopeptide (TPR) repeat protein
MASNPNTLRHTIRNDTPTPLELVGADGRKLAFAPLEQRELSAEDYSGFDLSEARRAGIVSHWAMPPSEVLEKTLGVAMVAAVMLGIACAVVASMGPPQSFSSAQSWHQTVWISGAAILVLIAVGKVIYETRSLVLVWRLVAQTLGLVVTLAIGVGLPVATVYYLGDGKALIEKPGTSLFPRLLQVAFIATASLLPTLLFFLFDRYRLNTIRDRLYRDLFRLDRRLATRAEIDAKYGRQIREAYGPEEQGQGRFASETLWPVLLCAFVVTMGWLSVFNPVGSIDASVTNPLSPNRTAPTFGFLGAYFFGLQLIARRYSRGDLKPKAYGYFTIRILTVAVLSWVLEAVWSADSTLTLLAAFLIGILPDEFFTLVREQFRGRGPEKLVPESEKHPLTRLEGIDLYDRARLEQEGIVNVESLAHHEFIHLVLETRIPVPRLVDWIDQAILYLHVIETDKDGQPSDEARQKLRHYGIRTTSDLLSCWRAAEDRGEGEIARFRKLLGGGDDTPHRLDVIRDALRDDEWLEAIRDWRRDEARETVIVPALPTSFQGKLDWAQYLEEATRYKDALETLESAIQIQDDAGARFRLARILTNGPVAVRDDVRAREHARRALELGQDNLAVMDELSRLFETRGETEDALAACRRAIALIGEPAKHDTQMQELLKDLKKREKDLEAKPKKAAAAG